MSRAAATSGRDQSVRVNAVVGARGGDLARAAVYLVSDLGASVTGQVVRADAGAHLGAPR